MAAVSKRSREEVLRPLRNDVGELLEKIEKVYSPAALLAKPIGTKPAIVTTHRASTVHHSWSRFCR